MKNLKKLLVVLLAAVMGMSFAACGAGSSADVPTYECVTEATFPPFDTVDEEDNIVGFDMDLITAIGEDQGFNVKFTDMAFDSLIPALQAGNGDIITAFMWPNDPDRQAKVDFTKDYYHSETVCLVAADNDSIKSEDDITTSTKVTTQMGTVYQDECDKWVESGKIVNPIYNNGFDVCANMVVTGQADCIISAKTMADEYMAQMDGKLKIACNVMPDLDSAAAFAVQKGNTELLEQLNAGLDNLVANGKYDEICKKWEVENTIG